MKLILSTFCLLFVVVQNVQGNTLMECLDEHGIKGDPMELNFHDDPKARCIARCLMEKEGILENGQVKLDKLKESLLRDAEKLGETEVTEIVDHCKHLLEGQLDVCDKVNNFLECRKDEEGKY